MLIPGIMETRENIAKFCVFVSSVAAITTSFESIFEGSISMNIYIRIMPVVARAFPSLFTKPCKAEPRPLSLKPGFSSRESRQSQSAWEWARARRRTKLFVTF